MSWKWYGVKTVFRTDASGKTGIVVPEQDRDATLVEERIVLIRARSFDEALSKGEAEAKDYAKETYHNVYEQIVRRRYLGACDAFELYDEPGAGVELFSTTEIIPRTVSDKDVVKRYIGQVETDAIKVKRRKFMNLEFNRGLNSELPKKTD